MKTILLLVFLCFAPSANKQTQVAKTRVLPPGISYVYSPIILNSGESLIGQNSTLILADGANCSVIIVGGLEPEPKFETKDVYISGIKILGNRENQKYEGWEGHPDTGGKSYIRNNLITVRRSSQVVIENMDLSGARSGAIVLEKGTSDTIIFNCKLYNNEFDGLAAYESTGIYASHLEISGNKYAGVSYDWNVERSFVSNSSIFGNEREGVFMRDSRNNKFSKIFMGGNGGYAIFLAKSEQPDSAASNNTFDSFTFSGNGGIFRVNDKECVGNVLSNPNYSLEPNLVSISKK